MKQNYTGNRKKNKDTVILRLIKLGRQRPEKIMVESAYCKDKVTLRSTAAMVQAILAGIEQEY